MEQTFYSNGKLLITGEYAVLDGAVALALPTRLGQHLTVNQSESDAIIWKAIDADGSIWYEDSILISDITENKQSGVNPVTDTLIRILHEASLMNPLVLADNKGFSVFSLLNFPRNWGLGTSSTLINNIAQWFQVDAFELLNKSFGGSGYDIACAQHNTPILYRLNNNKPVVTPATFNPPFASNLYFVYLNKKQNSKNAIAAYRDKRNDLASIIPEINKLTLSVQTAETLIDFCKAIEHLEDIMLGILETPTVRQSSFPDFNGSIKSLGAWGGDFVMAASADDPTLYFKERGYDIIISYRDMILNK